MPLSNELVLVLLIVVCVLIPWLFPAWINPVYHSNTARIQDALRAKGSLSLADFFLAQRFPSATALACDVMEGLGNWARPDYVAGCSQGWKVRGPPHLLRYCELDAISEASSRTKLGQVGLALHALRDALCSAAFVSWVERVCGVTVTGLVARVRRFRPGLDYTVAQHRQEKVSWREKVAIADLCWGPAHLCDLVLGKHPR